MILQLHGTGAGEPGGDRLASALSVTFADGSVLLLDAGEGCSRGMIRDGVDLMRITRVAISHMHADHWGGFPNLIMAWSVEERTEPVDLHVPPHTIEFFKQMQRISYMGEEELSFPIHYHTLGRIPLPDGWTLDIFETAHLESVREYSRRHGLAPAAYGYLLTNGARRIVLSQDLKSEDDLKGHLEGAGLLICESAHVAPRKVLEMAQEAGVERVLFTHVPPAEVSFPDRFEGVVWSIASDGERVDLGG